MNIKFTVKLLYLANLFNLKQTIKFPRFNPSYTKTKLSHTVTKNILIFNLSSFVLILSSLRLFRTEICHFTEKLTLNFSPTTPSMTTFSFYATNTPQRFLIMISAEGRNFTKRFICFFSLVFTQYFH